MHIQQSSFLLCFLSSSSVTSINLPFNPVRSFPLLVSRIQSMRLLPCFRGTLLHPPEATRCCELGLGRTGKGRSASWTPRGPLPNSTAQLNASGVTPPAPAPRPGRGPVPFLSILGNDSANEKPCTLFTVAPPTPQLPFLLYKNILLPLPCGNLQG